MTTLTPSVSTEEEWLTYLGQLPSWTPQKRKTLVLSPHPDDETLGVGGLIAYLKSQNVEVTVIAVTDGENAYNDINDLGQIRICEQEEALTQLGVLKNDIVRLSIKDSGVVDSEYQLEQALIPYIDQDTHIIAPWKGDFHPDHEAVGRVAEKLSRQAHAQLSFYFFWTWHHSNTALVKDLRLYSFPLTIQLLQDKLEALYCHASQLVHESGIPILTEALLQPAKRPFEVYYPYDL